MINRIKEFISLLFGFFALIIPMPTGADMRFTFVTGIAISLGIIAASLMFYLKGTSWLSLQLRANNKSLFILFASLLASLGIYLTLLYTINTPEPPIINIELLTYGISTFLLSMLFSLISILATDRMQN
ncbi:hypothetical protein ACW9HW_18425 [Pseudomonas sp. SDO5532_S415]|jgi:hypothetical protein|uniref:hypothetical protein n=1 Tax=Pseudomonas sp. Irchel 3A7 TaxID=2008913 RepID=UPI000BA33DA1|nr:hypothetical protein [Pseudomonas sp. Irchel 3A7]